MKTYTLIGNFTLQNLSISLIAVFFSAYLFAQNPPNAYLIDHRGIPLFDENDMMQSASYSDLQTAGLTTDHLQIHPDGKQFFWEIPNDDIPTEDYALTGGPPGFPLPVRFAGDVYAFENQYYFVPKAESESFPADAYDATTADFHFLPSAQAVANRIDENDDARIGPFFWGELNGGHIFYKLPDLNIILPSLDYGDTLVLDNDFEEVITLELTDGNTGDISFTGNGNLSSVLDLGSVITSHTQITIDATTGTASITLPDTNASTFSFSNQRWLSYTTSDTNGDPWQVGVYIGTNSAEIVGVDIFQSTTALADIHEIVVYGLDGIDNVYFIPDSVPSTLVAGEFYGGSANDGLTGISDNTSTRLYGEQGEDNIQGRSHDILYGGPGDDNISIVDGVTNLTIFGGDDNDRIDGGSGDERLYGGSGRDIIYSNDGHDVIFGGSGNDQLHAGSGVDIFVFDGNGDGSDQVGTPSTDYGDDIFQNEDKLYFINTTMTSRDDLIISATVINANEVVSIAYSDTPSEDHINLFQVDIEDAHLNRRSNMVFEDTNGNVTVNVDEGATGAVYWPVITDESFDYAEISHSISGSGADNGLFSIDATTGGLSFNTAPSAGTPHDTNADGIYEVSLITTDGTNNFSKSLTIYINETQPPTFDSTATATAIDENSGENQAVYTIKASDNVGVVRYGIGADDAATFDVDPDSGVVTLLENPDYEKMPSYSFEVRAFDAQENVASMIVTLAINDLDDEAPVIDSSTTADAIDENSGAGQDVYTITATDNVGVTSYVIGGTDASFFTVDDPSSGVVTLTADPDYETKASYTFTAKASDAAGNTGQQTVTLAINNVEDQSPIITSLGTADAILERTGAGQVVYTITATDDTEVTSYAIGGTDASDFTVDATTGKVTLTADPDYETKSSYSFTVTASDAAGNTSDPLTVTLPIDDLDETPPSTPSISLQTDTGTSNSDGITTDATIAISDLDIGTTYEFSRDNGVNWYLLGTTTATTATFDALISRDGALSGGATITQTGPGTWLYTSLATYSTDTPDSFYFDVNMPNPLQNDKRLLVESGNTGRGIAIFVQGADLKMSIGTDNDASDLTASGVFEAGKRYAILVELLPNRSVQFYVAQKNGTELPLSFGDPVATSADNTWSGNWSGTDYAQWALPFSQNIQGATVNTYVSFSANSSQFHQGRFYDQQGLADIWTDGIPSVDDPSTLSGTILVRQINNNGISSSSTPLTITYDASAPSIDSSTTPTVDENIGAGQLVYTITADDNVGATSYAIGGTDASAFSVNATTGAVTLTADPDYETKSSYSFTVTASDAAGNTSAAQTVSLTINDLNDNAPVFSSGSTVSIAEGETATGYTALATDADAGSTISYSITGGADHALFTLTGGALSFSAAPDYETPGDDDGNNAYELIVTASDSEHGATQTVIVTVTDVDETAPQLLDTPEGNHSEGVATIVLNLSEEVSLDGESIAEDFTITGAASNPVVTNISVSGSDVTLTLSGVVVQGEMVELSYTKSENAGSIVDGSGNRLDDFSVGVNFITFDLSKPKETEIFFSNPVRDRLEIHSGSVVKRVALYSLTGRKVLDQRPNRKTPSIEVSTLAKGMYLMKMETTAQQTTLKLVKQ